MSGTPTTSVSTPHRADVEWEKWGARDPYYGVVTLERYRAARIDPEALEAFFAGGEVHATHVLGASRTYFGPDFEPRSLLDFGCGVGRVLVPFGRALPHVVGVDVSPSMLEHARRNCDARGAPHVELVLSDDRLSRVQGQFDLVHSAIVLQHIEVARGRELFRRLLERVAPGGGAVLHVTFGKAYHPATFGQEPPARPAPPVASGSPWARWRQRRAPAPAPTSGAADTDPEMPMHAYNLSELAYLLYVSGVRTWHAEFSDHGGELGVMIYARQTAAS
jgi:SAM-dependent methyltransferase